MDDRFKEIKARADAASEYPWRVNTKENIGNDWLLGCVFDAGTARDDFNYIITTDHIRCSHMSGADAKDDATFIAHARADVPWLLKEVERLRAALDQAALELEEAGKILRGTIFKGSASLFLAAAEKARAATPSERDS